MGVQTADEYRAQVQAELAAREAAAAKPARVRKAAAAKPVDGDAGDDVE